MSRILIAEDETRIASFVEKGLRAAGFAVTVTADGSAALAEAQSGQFDLMILDIGLPAAMASTFSRPCAVKPTPSLSSC